MIETEAERQPPKVFISYRWSSPDHEDWVLRLATSLRADGVDAKLDKWHLKEGQDTLAFMESMVTDDTVEKVLLICDKGYVERADSRQGGVGTEAQIISAKVYEDTDQSKFAAIVIDLDEQGRPILPAYMSTRLYFDMSNGDAEASNYEKVVRWIFSEPFHALPPLGTRPNFLSRTYITGSPLYKVGNAGPAAAVRPRSNDDPAHVLFAIAEEAQTFHMQLVDESEAGQKVYQSIKELRPVSENAYRALRQIASTSQDKASDLIHAFFESLMKTWDYTPLNVRYTRIDTDAYQYFVHDLLVSFVAIAMEQRTFDLASEVLAMPFFKPKTLDQTGTAADYNEFRPYLESLEQIGRSTSRLSVHADLLNEAHEHSIVSQASFMEADLTLYLRGLLAPKFEWFPISGLYLSSTYGALPSYVRARSKRFYDRLKPMLLNRDADQLRTQLTTALAERRGLTFDYRKLDVNRLIAADELATSP